MATSFRKAQHNLPCQLCEQDTRIKCKCIDCDLLMCAKCQEKVHSKFKHANMHKVVDIKDIASYQNENSGTTDLKIIACDIHTSQTVCLFCVSCTQLVCPLCIANLHQKHDLTEIDKIYAEKISRYKNMRSKIDGDIMVQVEEKLSFLQVQTISDDLEFKKLRADILRKEQTLSKIFRKYFEELLSTVDMTRTNNEIKLKDLESTLKLSKKDLLGHKSTIDDIVNSKDPSKVLSKEVDELEGKLDEIELNSTPTSSAIVKFLESTIQPEVSKLVGFLVSASVKNTYCVDHYVCSITVQDNNSLWLYYGSYEGIRHVDPDRDMSVIDEFRDINALEIAAGKSNCLFYTTGNQVQMLSPNKKTKVLHNFSPHQPTTLLITEDNIVVGVIEDKGKKSKIQLQAKLVVLEISGKSKATYENDRNGIPLFIYHFPRSITATENGGLCFIDCRSIDDYLGRIVMFSENRFIQWAYEGNPSINTNEYPFSAVEVLATKSENVIVSDKFTNTLHIISKHGDILSMMDLCHVGIEKPGVMAIDKSGYLWVAVHGRWLYRLELSGM
ncbi:tripartite motif-containing protein 45-like [Mytilus californianus]|uniref:tripartite motif-containing protein 45-like n=1 Tax=Mytilus californianus TaxID=6549 RepID=UPI002245EAD1|nr:tripartite motif-containing protein 45-like [Mytilus californianus]